MKKLILFAIPAMMLCACGNTTQSASSATDTIAADTIADTTAVEAAAPKADPAKDVEEAANAIYGDVAKEKSSDDIIKAYGSADLKKALKDYNKAMEGAEIGDIDYDIFLQAQDFYKFSYSVKSVEMKGDDAASAVIAMKNSGEKVNVTLSMVKEDGKWVIDDIIGKTGSTKKIMRQSM